MAIVRRLRIDQRSCESKDRRQAPAEWGRSGGAAALYPRGADIIVSAYFIDTLRRFAPRRRVIAPDLPGRGRSAVPGRQAAIIATRCSRCVMRWPCRVVLLGHSLGGGDRAFAGIVRPPDRVAWSCSTGGAASRGGRHS